MQEKFIPRILIFRGKYIDELELGTGEFDILSALEDKDLTRHELHEITKIPSSTLHLMLIRLEADKYITSTLIQTKHKRGRPHYVFKRTDRVPPAPIIQPKKKLTKFIYYDYV